MRRKLAVLLVPIGALLVAMWTVKLPYYAQGPGPAEDVEPLIHLDGHQQFPSGGHLILTSVSFQSIDVFQAIAAWLDPHKSIVSEHVLVQPGQTEQQATQQAITEMDQSKVDAAYVVLSRLTTYPRTHGGGVLVEGNATLKNGEVDSKCPAYGHLFSGDVLTGLNGRPIRSVSEFTRSLRQIPSRTPLTLTGTADGRRFSVRLVRRPCGTVHRPAIGIYTVPAFPFGVSISSGDIGGPSAGLMWALGLHDLLTPGDLTGGRTVAGTGAISLDGQVGAIGGVQDKIAAAKGEGATVFLVPVDDLADARKVAGNLTLVPVRTFGQALRYLLAHGGSDR